MTLLQQFAPGDIVWIMSGTLEACNIIKWAWPTSMFDNVIKEENVYAIFLRQYHDKSRLLCCVLTPDGVVSVVPSNCFSPPPWNFKPQF